jgi:hypothetical protein
LKASRNFATLAYAVCEYDAFDENDRLLNVETEALKSVGAAVPQSCPSAQESRSYCHRRLVGDHLRQGAVEIPGKNTAPGCFLTSCAPKWGIFVNVSCTKAERVRVILLDSAQASLNVPLLRTGIAAVATTRRDQVAALSMLTDGLRL